MTGPGFDVDVAATTGIAERVGRATRPLEEAADQATGPPEAGSATGDVLAYIAALSRSVGTFSMGVQQTNDAVLASIEEYRGQDTAAGDRIGRTSIPGL